MAAAAAACGVAAAVVAARRRCWCGSNGVLECVCVCCGVGWEWRPGSPGQWKGRCRFRQSMFQQRPVVATGGESHAYQACTWLQQPACVCMQWADMCLCVGRLAVGLCQSHIWQLLLRAAATAAGVARGLNECGRSLGYRVWLGADVPSRQSCCEVQLGALCD